MNNWNKFLESILEAIKNKASYTKQERIMAQKIHTKTAKYHQRVYRTSDGNEEIVYGSDLPSEGSALLAEQDVVSVTTITENIPDPVVAVDPAPAEPTPAA